MSKGRAPLVGFAVALLLGGCGHPTATVGMTLRPVAGKAKPRAVAIRPAATPLARPAPASRPAASQTPAPTTGRLSVSLFVTGDAPVGALTLHVAEAEAPPAETTLTLKAGRATWTRSDVAPGHYTLTVTALDPDGKPLGKGTLTAEVKVGEPTAVTLDLHVNRGPVS